MTVSNHGSLFLFHYLTQAAKEWVEENVDVPTWAHWGGTTFAVEPRYAKGLVAGMIDAGLKVR